MRKLWTCLTLVLFLASGASILLALSAQDQSAAGFRRPDGTVSIPVGKYSGEELRRVLDSVFNQPKPYIEQTVWQVRASPYPTAEFERHVFRAPNPNVYSSRPVHTPETKPSDLLKSMVDKALWFLSLDWLIGRARAVVAFDAQSSVAMGIGNLSWTHTPVGTPRAVVVLIAQDAGTTDEVISVTYGGTSMTECTGSPNLHTTGEPGAAYCYFLGASILTGARTVLVTVNGTGSEKGAAAYTLTAAADTEIVDSDGTINSDSQLDPSVTLSLGGRTSWAAIGFHSGQNAVTGITPLASWNGTVEYDFGTKTAGMYRYLTVGSTDVTAGWTQTADDAVAMALAVSEISACGSGRFWVGGTGNWNNTVQWSDSTGGPSGCSVPTSSNAVTIDAASCTTACTITVNAAAAMASFTDSGFNDAGSSISLGANSWTNSGAETHSTSNLAFSCSTNGGSVSITGVLTLSGGNINCATSTTTGTVTGNTNISAAGSFFDFGSGAWAFNGTWTNSTTSASWDAGTGTVTFGSATGGTMTFAGANLSEAEFDSVTFTSSAGTPQTFTMATRGLRWLTTLSVTDSSSTTTLATASLALGAAADTPALSVGNGGILTANASVVVLSSVTMTGGTNGTITVTTGTWTVSGNWNTSGAGSVFSEGTTSLYTFDTTATVTLLSTDNTFSALTVSSGTVTLAANTVVTNTLTVSGGTLAKSTFTITAAALTMSGGDLTSTSGTMTVNGNVNVSDAASAIDFGSETWNVSGTWTNASTDGTVWEKGSGTVNFTSATGGTMTFAGTNLSEDEFNTVAFSSSAGTAQTFSMATRGLSATTVNVNDGVSTTELTTTVGNLAVTATTLNVTTGGILTANGSTLTVTSIDTSTGTYTVGTSSVVVSASGGTVNIDETANSLTVNSGISTTFSASFAWSGTLTATSAGTLTFGASSLTAGGGSAVITFASATITMSTGNWDTSLVTSGNFTATSSSVTFSGTGTVNISSGSSFGSVTVSGGTRTLSSQLTATSVTLSGGTTAKGTNTLTVNGGLVMSGGDLTSTSGDVTVTGNVNISSAASAIDLGSESWSVSGTWTNASTDGIVWEAGTGTVTFSSATGGTMTFAGANLAEAELNNSTFESSAGTSQTFTMATRGLRIAGTLAIQDSSSTTALDTSGSSLAITAPTVTVTSSGGILTANGSTLTVTSFNSVGGTYIVGTSTVVVDTSGGTISIDETANSLTVNSGISTTFGNSLTWSGTFTATSAGTLTFGANSLTSSGSATMTFASATVTMSTGSWDTSSAATFTATGSSVTFSGIGTVALNAGHSFGSVTISGGTRTQTSQLTATTITISGGTLATVAQTLTVNGDLVMSGGDLTSISGAAIVTGDVNISSAASAIDFGSETWTVSGSWSNSSTDTAVWDAGTGTVVFDDATAGTMTFGGTNLNENEFNNVTFSSSAGTPQTFTMATRALLWAGILTVSDSSSTTALATTDLGLTGGTVTVGNGGILTANASTVSVSSVTMTGGTSGTITVTTGQWTVSGNWDTSGAGSVFSEGTTSLYTFSATATITLLSTDNTFSALSVSGGTVTLATNTVVTNALTLSGGTFEKSTFTLTVGSLTMTGGDLTSTSGNVTVNGNVNISSSSSAIDFGSESWTVSGTWTNASTDGAVWDAGTGTVTFTSATGGTMTFAGSNLAEDEFNNVTFESSAGTAQTFTMATRGLRIGGTLTVSDSVSTTTLDTSGGNLAVTSAALTIGAGGILTVNASTLTVSGNWDSSGGTFNEGTSVVVLTASGTVNAGETFATFRVTGGTRTASGNLTTTTLEVTGGILAMGTNDIVFVTFDADGGSMTMNSLTVSNMRITTDSGTITWTLTSVWVTTDGSEDYQWTMDPSAAGATITFTARSMSVSTDYSILRDGITLDTQTSDGSGVVTFTVIAGWSPRTMQIVFVAGGGAVTPGGDVYVPQDRGIVFGIIVFVVIVSMAAVLADRRRRR